MRIPQPAHQAITGEHQTLRIDVVDAIARSILFAAADGPSGSMSIFAPASPSAHSIVDLAILTFVVTGLIFIIVEGVLLYSVWRFRQPQGEQTGEPPQVYGSMPIEVAWTAAPTLVVFFLVLVTTRTLWDVDRNVPQPRSGDNALFVTVIGHQWWWEYIYESYNGRRLGFTTANELHVPVTGSDTARSVYLTLKSADVCHSFWVPRLGGKVDLIPGRINSLQFEAHEPGLFFGQCAEFCGAQHANMLIRVTADSPAEFERWVANESKPAADDPEVREGKAMFLAQSCVNCHAVRGTPARGTYAPDLTHLMSRATLASGIVKNTTDTLADWIRDPQTMKPGCLMPAFGLPERDQKSIVRYLLTLR
jgi:cytochrome c oxidase subunit 2